MIEGNAGKSPAAHAELCPACGEKGREVKPITVLSLLTDEAKTRLSHTDGFRFCSTPTCKVSYFHPETGERFQLQDVRVRIGQKESEPPRPICYCFNYTIEEIEAEVVQEGTSKIPGMIGGKCAQGLNRCEESNPQGSCCLGNARKAVKEAQAKYPAAVAGRSSLDAATEEVPDCCAEEAQADEAPAGTLSNPRTRAMGDIGYRVFPVLNEEGGNDMKEEHLDEIGKALACGLRGEIGLQKPEFPAHLLRLLAEGRPVSPEQLASALDVSSDDITAALGSLPNLEVDGNGNVVGAFGLTLNPTPHHFQVGGHELYTWCALDALFLPAVLGQAARVESACAVTGENIRLTVMPDGVDSLEPAGALVSIVIPQASEACCSVRGAFCNQVHFISSGEAASEWLAANQGAIVLSVDEAHKLGRILIKSFFEGTPNA